MKPSEVLSEALKQMSEQVTTIVKLEANNKMLTRMNKKQFNMITSKNDQIHELGDKLNHEEIEVRKANMLVEEMSDDIRDLEQERDQAQESKVMYINLHQKAGVTIHDLAVQIKELEQERDLLKDRIKQYDRGYN